MTVQRLHPNLAAVDLLTAKELNESMGHHFDTYLREQYRGMSYTRRYEPVNATSWTSDRVPNGYVWSIRHIGVGFVSGDTGTTSGFPLSNSGTVTNPGAFAAIAATSTVPTGYWSISGTIFLSGTVTTADANNLFIGGSGNPSINLVYPGVVNTPVSFGPYVQYYNGTGNASIITSAAASGASAVYNAQIVAQPITNGLGGDALIVVLGENPAVIGGGNYAPVYVSTEPSAYQVATFSTSQMYLRPGEVITLSGANGNQISTVLFGAIQVPAEMIGKIL